MRTRQACLLRAFFLSGMVAALRRFPSWNACRSASFHLLGGFTIVYPPFTLREVRDFLIFLLLLGEIIINYSIKLFINFPVINFSFTGLGMPWKIDVLDFDGIVWVVG